MKNNKLIPSKCFQRKKLIIKLHSVDSIKYGGDRQWNSNRARPLTENLCTCQFPSLSGNFARQLKKPSTNCPKFFQVFMRQIFSSFHEVFMNFFKFSRSFVKRVLSNVLQKSEEKINSASCSCCCFSSLRCVSHQKTPSLKIPKRFSHVNSSSAFIIHTN